MSEAIIPLKSPVITNTWPSFPIFTKHLDATKQPSSAPSCPSSCWPPAGGGVRRAERGHLSSVIDARPPFLEYPKANDVHDNGDHRQISHGDDTY